MITNDELLIGAVTPNPAPMPCASTVFPVPSSPESNTTSPARSRRPIRSPNRLVAVTLALRSDNVIAECRRVEPPARSRADKKRSRAVQQPSQILAQRRAVEPQPARIVVVVLHSDEEILRRDARRQWQPARATSIRRCPRQHLQMSLRAGVRRDRYFGADHGRTLARLMGIVR